MRTLTNFLTLGAAVLTALACAHDSGRRGAENPSAATDEPASDDLSDGQVVAVLLALNRGEASHGEVATARAADPRVRELAETMVRDHGQAAVDVEALAQRRDILASSSETEITLRRESDSLASELGGESGAAFDLAYVDAQVRGHEGALQLLDATLIPTTEDAELRAMLPQLRDTVAEHLGHARRLQGEFVAEGAPRTPASEAVEADGQP